MSGGLGEQCPVRDKGMPHEFKPVTIRDQDRLQCAFCGMVK